MTFKGLCPEHDAKIFKQIEGKSIDFNSYNSRLLFSYRALLYEYRVKEDVIEALFKSVTHPELNQYMDVEEVQTTIVAEQTAMWDTEFVLLTLQEDLNNYTEQFSYEIISIPKVEVRVSAIFSYTSLGESFLTDPPDLSKKEPISGMVFNIIPTTEDTKVI